MGAKIDCYIDTASYYSYICFLDLLPNLQTLQDQNVQVEFHPVLIAGLNRLTGNSPPWKLRIKGKYLSKDAVRAAARVHKPDIRFPQDFLSMALTTSPQRALLYIKENFPRDTFLAATACLFDRFWSPPHVNLTVDENLAKVLGEVSSADLLKAQQQQHRQQQQSKLLFSDGDVKSIMEGRTLMKDVLKEQTEKVMQLGGFGLPWLLVENGKGEKEPFFGSDRFHDIYKFLGVPYQGVKLLPASKL